MNILQPQINRTINSAINDRVVPGLQKIWLRCFQDRGTLSPQRPLIIKIDSCGETNRLKTKLRKYDSMSAFDLRDFGDRSRHFEFS